MKKTFSGWNYKTYQDEFLSLKCAGDVLNVVSPLGNKAKKEISESMAIIKVLRPIILKNPHMYTLYDLCAGNALTSVIAVHLLSLEKAIAIDKRKRKRRWNKIKRFEYTVNNLFELKKLSDARLEGGIIIAVHPCGKLANEVIRLYNNSPLISHLILMPCCNGKIDSNFANQLNKLPKLLRNRINKYELWCWYLASLCKGSMTIDKKVLSPKNIIVTASKKVDNE